MELAIFGSAATGACDSASDFDVIALVDEAAGLNKDVIRVTLSQAVGRDISLSIYGERRLKSLWEGGSPFAWHLYLEAQPFPGQTSCFLRKWGAPAPYRAAKQDCEMMVAIIDSVAKRLAERVACDCYEAGLLYVGARNVGMFASSELLGDFDFSRASPFSLLSILPFPLSREDFDNLVRARHATARGAAVPLLDRQWLVQVAGDLSKWSRAVVSHLERKSHGV